MTRSRPKWAKRGQRTFSATFTHSEAENYNTVTVMLTVTVEKAAHASTPLTVRLKNNKHAKAVKPLIGEAMRRADVEPLTKYSPVDYCAAYEETEALIEKGFIKRLEQSE